MSQWCPERQRLRGLKFTNTLKEEKQKFEDLQGQYEDIETLLEMGYEEIFKCLSEEKQKELLEQKAVFAKMAEIELK